MKNSENSSKLSRFYNISNLSELFLVFVDPKHYHTEDQSDLLYQKHRFNFMIIINLQLTSYKESGVKPFLDEISYYLDKSR